MPKLTRLLQELPHDTAPTAHTDVDVTGVSSDSRRVRPGHIFVAVPGTRLDGHDYIHAAVARGAVAIIGERLPNEIPVPGVRVPNARMAVARLARAYYNHPGDQLTLMGVTGSVGKTSTSLMLAQILMAAGYNVGVIGSLGIRFNEQTRPSRLTTPDAVALQETLRDMVAAGVDTVVMEVSSHALQQHRVDGLLYDLGVFTNLLRFEHENFHQTFEQYVAAKARFLDLLADGAPLVFNVCDPEVRRLAGRAPVPTIGFSVEGRPGQVVADNVSLTPRGSRCTVRWCPHQEAGAKPLISPASFALTIPLLGIHNVTNAVAAAAASLVHGIPPATIQHALGRLSPFSRRMEVIYDGEITVLDDTVGNPHSIESLFAALAACEFRELVVLFAIRGNRGTEVNRANATALVRGMRNFPTKTLVITSSTESTQAGDQVRPAEESAFLEALENCPVPWRLHRRLDQACEAALQAVKPGDTLLLLGAQGMDNGAATILNHMSAERLLAR